MHNKLPTDCTIIYLSILMYQILKLLLTIDSYNNVLMKVFKATPVPGFHVVSVGFRNQVQSPA